MASTIDIVKNHRVFQAIVGTNALGVLTAPITIQSPFTCEFDITRGSYNSMNHMVLRIYNLNEHTRNSIYWDETNFDNRPSIEFKAGYGIPNETSYPWDLSAVKLISCFKGVIWRAYSVRQGTDFITTIECRDGADAFNSAQVTSVSPAGTDKQKAISDTIATLLPYGVSKGVVSTAYTGTFPRGNTVGQRSLDYLQELTNGGTFIDNGVVHCLPDNECIPNGLPLINSSSGLLNTPQREGNFLDIDILFEPRFLVFQQTILDATTGPSIFNGQYKVLSVRHHGLISEVVCGSATTSLGLFFGTFATRVAGQVP